MPAALPKTNDWDSPCGSHFAHLCAASINKRHEFNREPWKWKCSRDSANPALDFGHLDIIRYFLVALLRWTATLESDCVRAYALHTARSFHAQDTLWRVRKVLVPPLFFLPPQLSIAVFIVLVSFNTKKPWHRSVRKIKSLCWPHCWAAGAVG